MGTQKSCLIEHPKHMFKLMDKKIITILGKLFLLNWPYATCNTQSFKISHLLTILKKTFDFQKGFLYVFVLSCVCYVFVRVCLYVLCGHLLGKGWPLGSRLWCLTVSLSLSHWYPGSGVVLDCIDSLSLHPYLLASKKLCIYFGVSSFNPKIKLYTKFHFKQYYIKHIVY